MTKDKPAVSPAMRRMIDKKLLELSKRNEECAKYLYQVVVNHMATKDVDESEVVRMLSYGLFQEYPPVEDDD